MESATAPPTHRGKEWADQAHHQLADHGYKAGGARSAVIELLGEQGGCLDAEAVAERLRKRGRKVGTASVYRALALLSEMRLLQRVALANSPDRFELILAGGEHHHHLVCERCGAMVAFSDDALERAVEQIGDRSPFTVETHEITLHGLCETCTTAAR